MEWFTWDFSLIFPNKKRINAELFIDKWATLYVVNGRNENEGQRQQGQPSVLVDPRVREWETIAAAYTLSSKMKQKAKLNNFTKVKKLKIDSTLKSVSLGQV